MQWHSQRGGSGLKPLTLKNSRGRKEGDEEKKKEMKRKSRGWRKKEDEPLPPISGSAV